MTGHWQAEDLRADWQAEDARADLAYRNGRAIADEALEQLRKEVEHWKANCAEETRKKRALHERYVSQRRFLQAVVEAASGANMNSRLMNAIALAKASLTVTPDSENADG